jgi:6-phosphogluconolactonase
VLYLGSSAAGSGEGVGVATVRDGALRLESTAPCPPRPSYLAVAPDGRTLYAAHELEEGLVSAFAIGERGEPRLLGTQPCGGAEPCHLSVHPSGRFVLSAHWGSGSVAVQPIDGEGLVGPPTDVVEHPKRHAHMVVTDPAGRWVLAVHLGAGTVSTYHLDLESGRLELRGEARLHAGAGPRHLAFHPDGATVYVVNELDSTVTACRYETESGRLTPEATVRTLPEEAVGGNYPSAIRVAPDGRFVYVGNRGHDSIGVLSTVPSLRLVATHPSGGEFPRDLAFSRDGRLLWIANQRGDRIVGLAVDPADGSLSPTSLSLLLPKPTCVLPVPSRAAPARHSG